MKAISLKEPWANLIMEGKKKVETRSWKTNYRGELYIHASNTKITKDIRENLELMNLVKEDKLNFGNIICRCKLVDCVLMTKEYVLEMEKMNKQEFICGEYKEGRYAWILKDIEIVKPIPIKGKLGVWNF